MLITVIGLLLVLTIIVSTLVLTSRNEVRSRAALNAHTEQQVLADGTARLVAFRLAEQRGLVGTAGRAPLDGTALVCRDESQVIETRVTDVNGLVDINAASADLLTILLKGIGVEGGVAANLAAAIVDFRDPDDVALPGGAESAEYARAGRAYGPKNAPFDSIYELDQVLGMTPEILFQLLPLVTTHSRAGSLDTNVMPMPLLLALTRGQRGMDATLSSREQFSSPVQLAARPVTRGGTASRTRTAAYHIQVTVTRVGGRKATRSAVVELSTRAETGFIVREWATPPLSEMPNDIGSAQLPRCETSL